MNLKHFKIRVGQTKEETLIDIFAENKKDALIEYLNHHHDKEKGFVFILDVKQVK